MGWRVTRGGVMLDVVTGTKQDATARDVPVTETRTFAEGVVLREPLALELVERWEAGDRHLRSILERVGVLPEGEA